MGTIRHDAIVVTSNEENTHKAHAKAIELGLLVTNFCDTNMNGYSSFLVCPDGSKEGFDVSKAMDKARDEFKTWLDDICVDWVHISYGESYFYSESLEIVDSNIPYGEKLKRDY